jgi:predicted DNA-binding ribbon-helix-helix protein
MKSASMRTGGRWPAIMPSESQLVALGKIIKPSLGVAGHRSSISLEWAFWDELRAIANARSQPLAILVAAIDATRGGANLSSAIRVFVLNATRRSPAFANGDVDLKSVAGETNHRSRRSMPCLGDASRPLRSY